MGEKMEMEMDSFFNFRPLARSAHNQTWIYSSNNR